MATLTAGQLATTNMPLVYISVLNWYYYEQTINCLHQLEKLDYEPKTIFVVDNASPNDSAARIRAEFPHLRLIQAKENLGYAAGHRHTVDVALAEGADLIWLINSDITFESNALSELVNAYLKSGDAIYGSVILNAQEPFKLGFSPYALSEEGVPDLFRRDFSHGTLYVTVFATDQPRQVANVSGCSLMVPLQVVNGYGFMREDFFMFWEETEYCLRLRALGIKSYVVPSSRVFHHGRAYSEDHSRIEAVLHYYLLRNGLIVRRVYKGWWDYLRHIWYRKNIRTWLRTWLQSMRDMERLKMDISLLREYLRLMALRDSLVNRTGKVYAPEDFIE